MPGLLADGEFPPPITEEFEWPSLIDIQIGGLNLSINRPVLLTFLATAAVAVLFWLAFRKPKTVPGKLQNLMEAGVEFVAVDMPMANKLTVHILAAVAEHEREMISARPKAALAAAKARGTRLGNPAGLSAEARIRGTAVGWIPERGATG